MITLGVVIAGIVMLYTGWIWLDPILSLVIVVLITYGTWRLLRDSVNLALDAVPEGIDMNSVQQYLANLPTCIDVHDLHVWGMPTTETALTAHVVMTKAACDDALLSRTANELHNEFGIEHTTYKLSSATRPIPAAAVS